MVFLDGSQDIRDARLQDVVGHYPTKFVEIVGFASMAAAILVVVHFLQLLTVLLFGMDAHAAVFILERHHWYRMWTPFTSAIAHATPVHLFGNLSGIILFGGTAVALIGKRMTLAGIYLAAVLAQLMGVVSGRGDILGASGGVTAAAGFSVITSPLWLRQLLPWGRRRLIHAVQELREGRLWPAYEAFIGAFTSATVPLLVAVGTGVQLANDVAGTRQFLSFPWGTAPAGPVYTAHLFGFALGGVLGTVVLVRSIASRPTREPTGWDTSHDPEAA